LPATAKTVSSTASPMGRPLPHIESGTGAAVVLPPDAEPLDELLLAPDDELPAEAVPLVVLQYVGSSTQSWLWATLAACTKRLLPLVGWNLCRYGRRGQRQRNDQRELHAEPSPSGSIARPTQDTQTKTPLPENVSASGSHVLDQNPGQPAASWRTGQTQFQGLQLALQLTLRGHGRLDAVSRLWRPICRKRGRYVAGA
jgi:hypothetical protein